MRFLFANVTVVMVLAAAVGPAGAELTGLDFITVGNAGNANDSTGYGAVNYRYRIGKYEVTAGQYTAFLNSVAQTDIHGLYNTEMWSTQKGCKIERLGSSGSYTYRVAADRANRPVNWVSWGDTARFSNWLHNGQGSGDTEDGAYYLNGATSRADLMGVTRKAGAKYWLPSENEWYKAAYHKNDGATGNYWAYPTISNSVPSNLLTDPDPGNNANFFQAGYTLGDPYWTNVVGDFENSASPYGTFDQAGNIWEWNEAVIGTDFRGIRGGGWNARAGWLSATARFLTADPTLENGRRGFRVARVPEPSTLTLFAVVGMVGAFVAWRRRRRT